MLTWTMALIAIAPTSPPLSRLVETIWDCDLPLQQHGLERLMPVAKVNVIINLAEDETRVYEPDTLSCRRLSGFTLDGPRDRHSVIDTREQTAVMGVVFRPGGAAPFFRERIDMLRNEYIDLFDLLGHEATHLRARLLDTRAAEVRLAILCNWLSARAEHSSPSSRVLVHAVSLLDRSPQTHRIGDVASACELSPRRLHALFSEQVGMSPKRYARLQRFHRVIASVHQKRDVDWAGVAFDCGFHDQPHLAREFRAFSGLTPSAYVAQQTVYPGHVPLD